MEEQQLCFNNLPTEALFSFFCTLEPNLLGNYSTVCKRWNQLCRDNELWRRYCLEKWDNNPKESDCAKNWFIPVREGVGSKENRIDWKRCYLIRSLHDQATKFLVSKTELEKKQRLGFLKRKNAKKTKQSASSDLFAKGWPTVVDLPMFEKKICDYLANPPADEERSDNENNGPDFLALTSFFVELELSIMRQINISRVKYLGIGGRFLEFIAPIIRIFPGEIPARLVKYAIQYTQLAKEKDIPIDSVAGFLDNVTSALVDLIGHVGVSPRVTIHLTQFVATVITAMSQPLQDGLKEWATEEVNKRPSSPTLNFEVSLHRISDALENKPEMQLPLFDAAIKQALGVIDSPIKAITMLAAITAALEPACNEVLANNNNLHSFMATYILPFWKPSQDPEYLIPLLHFVSDVYSSFRERIHEEYVAAIIPPLLEMSKHENQNVRREVANFVVAYCENLNNPETLVPYLSDLLDAMFGYFSCPSAHIRCEAVRAISSLLISCHTSFMKHKDRMMTEFKKLLGGSAEDRKSVIEALARVGAGIGEHKESIENDIEILYEQLVEDCKKDRMAHIDLLLKMTEFSVVALGPKFSKHSPFVFPLVLEYVRMPVDDGENGDEGNHQMDMEEDDEDNAMPNAQRTYPHEAVSRKESALRSLLRMIELFDRATFLAHHEEIALALEDTVRNPEHNINDHLKLAWSIFLEYIKKLFVKEDSQWANSPQMWQYWLNLTALLIAAVRDTDLFQMKSFYVFQITSLFKHFCSLSPPEQPFVSTSVMQHLSVIFSLVGTQYYEAEVEEMPFEELFDLGSEMVDLLEAVCANRTDKDVFWSVAEHVLASSAGMTEDNEVDEYRWLDVCLVGTIYEHFGEEFLGTDRAIFLNIIPACKEVRTPEMYQTICNHLGVMVRKFPKMVPRNIEAIDEIFSYLEPLLVGDRCQREAAPSAYDNALMALSSLLLFMARVTAPQSHDVAVVRVLNYMPVLTSALPPATNGDDIEAKICIEQYCQLLQTTQVYFEGDAGAELKADVIRALKETMEMKEYNTPELHAFVDPLLEQLQS